MQSLNNNSTHICQVVKSNGSTVQIKNLGWLFRHSSEVERFEIYGRGEGSFLLVAIMRDGSRFESDYASWATALDLFFPRSIWEGLQVWFYDCTPTMMSRHQGYDKFSHGLRTFQIGANELVQKYMIGYYANQYTNRRGQSMSDYALSYLGPQS